MASRSLAKEKLDHAHCFIDASSLMEWKNQQNMIVSLDEMKQKVGQYSDKSLQLLMQQLLVKMDYSSLGFESKLQKAQAATKLLRLVPH